MTNLTIFVNTRPPHRGDFGWLVNAGVLVYHLPLLEIESYDDGQLAKRLDNLLAGHYALVVVVSVTAVTHLINRLKINQLTELKSRVDGGCLTIMAVGQATKIALAKVGLTAISPIQENNEGMMAMPVLKQLIVQKSPVLFCKGVGGRTLLADFLRQHGCVVDDALLYQRTKPKNLLADVATLFDQINHARILVLISSQTAFEYWQYAIATLGIDMERFACSYVCLGERLAGVVSAEGGQVVRIDGLDEKGIGMALSGFNNKH